MDDVIDEQIRYYRARAPEYDATSRPDGDPFAQIEAAATDDLRACGPVHSAIELGAGTGLFTGVLATIADHVTAVDASPEALRLNQAKTAAPNVDYVAADVFDWTPPEPADLVVFAALLSHIPSARFEAFWASVARMLVPGGRVFVIDESDHGLWDEERVADDTPEIVYRTLSDGRRFRIVKVLWDPVVLGDRLRRHGWSAEFVRRDPFFWGAVSKARP